MLRMRSNFYPRSPCGERRVKSFMRNGFFLISIHALLAESDCWARSRRQPSSNFYPRSPCGERRPAMQAASTPTGFLSTLSLRRATHPHYRNPRRLVISIHALLAESDANEALQKVKEVISIHALLAESDPWDQYRDQQHHISIHALLAESDILTGLLTRSMTLFLSTLSLRRATLTPIIPSAPYAVSMRARLAVSGGRKCYHSSPAAGISIHALLAESDTPTIYTVAVILYFYPRSPCGERLSRLDAEY